MKELISTVAVVTDATKPSETSLVLFKDIRSNYDAETQSETVYVTSYKVIDDNAGEYEYIKEHSRSLDKADLDALVAGMTISATDYTDIRNEQLVKGVQSIIDTDAVFGLSAAQLTLR